MGRTTPYKFRNKRKREVRSLSINIKRMTKRDIEIGRLLYSETEYWRPKTRGDCSEVPRPCPYVSCKYNLYLDVNVKGNIKLNFPDIEPEDMPKDCSCALDVADLGGETLEKVGEILNLTRERIRQLEVKVCAEIRRRQEARVLKEFWGLENTVAVRPGRGPGVVDAEAEVEILEDFEEPEVSDATEWEDVA